MIRFYLHMIFVALTTFIFIFNSYAQNESRKNLEDVLRVQTLVLQTELYRDYKRVIEEAISAEEIRLAKQSQQWNTQNWHDFVDMLIEEEIILALDDSHLSKDEKREQNKLKNSLSKGMKNGLSSMIAMGRVDGTGTIIAYIGGSAAGYAMAGLGVMIGSASMVSFFSLFPFATVTVSAVMAVNNINDKIHLKEAFNRDEEFDYYKEYKEIQKQVQRNLKVKKDDLIYVFNDDHGVLIRKRGFIPGLLSFLGFSKDKLSLTYLIKSLKREGLYTPEIKKLKKSKKLGYIEKIVSIIHYIEKNFSQEDKELILNKFEKQKISNLPLVSNMQEIVSWAMDTVEIKDLRSLTPMLAKAPKGTPFVTLVKVYQDFIFPKLAKTIQTASLATFKCLRQGFYEQIAVGYKNVRLEYDIHLPPAQMMNSSIEACL